MRLLHKAYRLLALTIGCGLIVLAVRPVMAEYANDALPDQSGPAYWLDQGGLFATYGNYPAAVRAYQKAIELDVQNAEAYFDLGVSYGAMGDADQALLYINKAISMDAGQERYIYGRAWTLLIAGKKEQALLDFKKAADMGDLDAQMYLQQEAAQQ
jgi:Flp pilus assembly protein TadD